MDLDYIDPNTPPFYHFGGFSASWIALFEYCKLVCFSMPKDLRVFMKMGFLGAVCVLSMITFVVIYGFIGISNTDYEFKFTQADSATKGLLWQDPLTDTQDLLLVNSQFSNLAGILCAGYFIHQCSLPIIQ
jgi:hypothetical protein